MTPPPLIEARDLAKAFPGPRRLFGRPEMVRAVDGVSLSVRQGETFAVVGESGCGKSTLARLMAGLLAPDAGRVLYKGRDVTNVPAVERRALRSRIQFVFQDPFSSLNPRMTVGALVEEPLRAHGIGAPDERREKARALLRRVGLRPEHADRWPHEFSGGQRQRVAIARALACGPRLLIADEPVSALDVSIQAQVMNLLAELKAEFGLTLLIIAHDLGVIRHMSDRVAVMYLGEIVEVGPTAEVFGAPRHPYARALISAAPAADPSARAPRTLLQGDPPSPAAPPSGCRFHTRCPFADDRCAAERPSLLSAGPLRAVACHRHGALPRHEGPRTPRSPSVATARRFALYRELRQRQEAAVGPDDDRGVAS